MSKEEKIVVPGIVIEALPNATFKVKISGDKIVLGHISGKIRMHHITILVGDEVQIEMSPYDWSRGRIIRRGKSAQS